MSFPSRSASPRSGASGAAASVVKEEWFSFGDSCVRVLEKSPASPYAPSYNEVLIFLHGRFGDSEIWSGVTNQLATKYRCFCVDLPGFGRSFNVARRSLSLLEHTLLIDQILRRKVSSNDRGVLVGHDVGGVIAQLGAIKAPEKVSALVLMNSCDLARPLEGGKPGMWGWRSKRMILKLLAEAEAMKPEHKALLLRPWKSRSTRLSLARAIRFLFETWPQHYERQKWKKEIQKLDIPILLLWGNRDLLNSKEKGLDLLRHFTEVYYYETENSSHWVNLEDTDWVSRKMLEFLFNVTPAHVQRSLL